MPIDRRVALAEDRDLTTEVWGSALEADLSGFTALTETLSRELGEQRGAEELGRRLNVLYDGLITEVHRFGGTVLGFAGDAFTSWLDGDDGSRAVACAQELQRWMSEHAAFLGDPGIAAHLPPPGLKVAVATGATRRYLVGDPSVQLIEGLAGQVMDELADVEHGADPGDVVLAPSTRRSLGARVVTGERGEVLRAEPGAAGLPPFAAPGPLGDAAGLDRVRPWLLEQVFDRIVSGGGDFLAELRPATAIFLRFGGIAFETEPDALDRLDAFVRAVQAILAQFDGNFLELTIGDKGAYLYIAFGAPVAHEDDPTRALLAALRLRDLGGRGGIESVSIGIATGRMRAGSYGARQMRNYGVIGDAVNLAARLMQAAGPGQIIATKEVRAVAGSGFRWSEHPDLTVKGKVAPIGVALLEGSQRVGAASAVRGADRTALLGRQDELARLREHLAACVVGTGAVVAVTGEAGLGKTRLVGELTRDVADGGVRLLQSECPSYGVTGSYVVWRSIWTALFELDEVPEGDRAARVTERLAEGGEEFVARAPLLAPVLGLSMADSELTAGLDAKVRKTSLEATLAEWLRATTATPTLLVLEDCHWIDALSEDLLEAVGRVLRDVPLLIVLTHRPRADSEGGALAVARQPHYREVALGPLTDDDVDEMIRMITGDSLPKQLIGPMSVLGRRAEGNPFYVQELVDYVLELGPSVLDPARLAEMPSSLQRLVLSRIDRLSAHPRTTVRVASVIGRSFATDVLVPVHPDAGGPQSLAADLDALERSRLVAGEVDDPGHYAFVHAVTQEVAYSTITTQTRADLHSRIGRVIEEFAGDDVVGHLDLTAHHFARGDDEPRRRRYVRQAAEAARARYANASAIELYRNVLPLLEGAERTTALLDLGRTLGLTGDFAAADESFATAEQEAEQQQDARVRGCAEMERAEVMRKQGRLDDAATLFERARSRLEQGGFASDVADVLHFEATLAAQRGDYALARERFARSLTSRRELADRRGQARSLNGLGIVAEYEGDLAGAAELYEQALAILVELGDTWGMAALTNNAGMTFLLQDDPVRARPLFERAVALQREIGDPQMLANFLSNLGDAARELGDLDAAAVSYAESLTLAEEVDELWLIAYLLEDVAMLAASRGAPAAALRMAAAGARLRDEIGTPLPRQSQERLDDRLAASRAALTDSEAAAAQTAGAELPVADAIRAAYELLGGPPGKPTSGP